MQMKRGITCLLLFILFTSSIVQFFGIKSYCACDETPPVVTIISPMNTIYYTTDVSLEYKVDEPTSWVGYSLDGGVKCRQPTWAEDGGYRSVPEDVSPWRNGLK